MSIGRLKRNLLNKLVNARIDLAAYLQLRKAKGYMTVSESDHLRENLFDLCTEMRNQAAQLSALPNPKEREALRHAAEAMVAAAVSLMGGRHDCPQYVAVDADKLERCLAVLITSIQQFNSSASLTSA